jgi:hypothetical protein
MTRGEYANAERDNIRAGLQHELDVAIPSQRTRERLRIDSGGRVLGARGRDNEAEVAARAAAKREELENLDAVVTQRHRAEVIYALRAGKTVPPEVLADYPDLAKKS